MERTRCNNSLPVFYTQLHQMVALTLALAQEAHAITHENHLYSDQDKFIMTLSHEHMQSPMKTI